MSDEPRAGAHWVITRDACCVVLHHRNLLTGHQEPLGRLEPQVTDDEVVEWITSFSHPQVGDLIYLSCGSILRWLPKGLEVCQLKLDSGRVLPRSKIIAA